MCPRGFGMSGAVTSRADLRDPSNGFYRASLAGSVPVAAGGSALHSSDLGGLAADRAPAGREEAKPLLG